MVEITGQRGSTLLEATIAIGIVAVVGGAALSAGSMAAGAAGHAAVRAALQDAAERELHVAVDALKYQGVSLVPATIATSVPLAGASPVPAQISLSSTTTASGATSIGITVSLRTDPAQNATIYATLDERAPLPGTTLRARGVAPAPTGAP